jgi:hypothetical protein
VNVRGAINGGATPLFWAAAKSQPELVRVLLRHGAQVNVSFGRGETALRAAQQVASVHAKSAASLQMQVAQAPPEQRAAMRKLLKAEQAKWRDAVATVRLLKQAGATR